MLELSTDNILSPPVELSVLRTRHGHGIHVVRDDLLTGGTKERALWEYLRGQNQSEFIYASPFSGYAQIALAYVSKHLGRRCIIIAETDPSTGEFHPYTIRAKELGAEIFPSRNLGEAEEIARGIATARTGMVKIPLGFDVPEFRNSMARVLSREWERVESTVPTSVKRLWIPVGSGTLASSFLSFLPERIEVKALNVRVLARGDVRIQRLEKTIDLRHAEMPFKEKARHLPEIPSNLYYDAKIWALLDEEGRPGDVWWNVAG